MPGARARLRAKALQPTGGPTPPPADPAGRSVYAALVAGGQADIFLTDCTNALQAVREEPAPRSVAVPAAIQAGAEYGVTVLAGAAPADQAFVDFVLGPRGRALLEAQGFGAPWTPCSRRSKRRCEATQPLR